MNANAENHLKSGLMATPIHLTGGVPKRERLSRHEKERDVGDFFEETVSIAGVERQR